MWPPPRRSCSLSTWRPWSTSSFRQPPPQRAPRSWHQVSLGGVQMAGLQCSWCQRWCMQDCFCQELVAAHLASWAMPHVCCHALRPACSRGGSCWWPRPCIRDVGIVSFYGRRHMQVAEQVCHAATGGLCDSCSTMLLTGMGSVFAACWCGLEGTCCGCWSQASWLSCPLRHMDTLWLLSAAPGSNACMHDWPLLQLWLGRWRFRFLQQGSFA